MFELLLKELEDDLINYDEPLTPFVNIRPKQARF